MLLAHSFIGILLDEDKLFQIVHNLGCQSDILVGILQPLDVRFDYFVPILVHLVVEGARILHFSTQKFIFRLLLKHNIIEATDDRLSGL